MPRAPVDRYLFTLIAVNTACYMSAMVCLRLYFLAVTVTYDPGPFKHPPTDDASFTIYAFLITFIDAVIFGFLCRKHGRRKSQSDGGSLPLVVPNKLGRIHPAILILLIGATVTSSILLGSWLIFDGYRDPSIRLTWGRTIGLQALCWLAFALVTFFATKFQGRRRD